MKLNVFVHGQRVAVAAAARAEAAPNPFSPNIPGLLPPEAITP